MLGSLMRSLWFAFHGISIVDIGTEFLTKNANVKLQIPDRKDGYLFVGGNITVNLNTDA